MQPGFRYDEQDDDSRRLLRGGNTYEPYAQSLCCPHGQNFGDTFNRIAPYYCLFVGTIVFLAVFGLILNQINGDA